LPYTKIELNHNKVAKISSLDELAALLFPGNKSQQKIFLSIFIELKYSKTGYLSDLEPLCDLYGFSQRTLATVRAKLRRLGIIDHVSRKSARIGYREGWVFSSRFLMSLKKLGERFEEFRGKKDGLQERKDRDLFLYYSIIF
jgi:hypothetical protein